MTKREEQDLAGGQCTGHREALKLRVVEHEDGINSKALHLRFGWDGRVGALAVFADSSDRRIVCTPFDEGVAAPGAEFLS